MLKHERPLVLGSGSPRRREMLDSLGLDLIVAAPDVDETQLGESPLEYVRAVTLRKLEATVDHWKSARQPHSGALCADTIVCLDGEVLQKPVDSAQAVDMLGKLVGRRHEVTTAFAIWARDSDRLIERSVTTSVTFRAASRDEILAYARSGEGLDKAGAYAVQGLGAIFVERIYGSYSNVVGLPLCEVYLDLVQLGMIQFGLNKVVIP